MNYVIRKRIKEDCKDIAHVVTISWNETYQGIVPDYFLEELKNNEQERANKTFNEFDEKDNLISTASYLYDKISEKTEYEWVNK